MHIYHFNHLSAPDFLHGYLGGFIKFLVCEKCVEEKILFLLKGLYDHC